LLLVLAGLPALALALPEPPALLKPTDSDGPLILHVFFESPEQLASIAAMSKPRLVDHRAGFAVIAAGRAELEKLEFLGLKSAINREATRLERDPPTIDQLKSIRGYGCYRTVEETLQSAQALVRDRPDLARIVDIGDSWVKASGTGQGYDLRVLVLSNRQLAEAKPPIFLNSAIHAREYATAELTTRLAEHLVARYDQDAQINWLLDHREVHLLLVANPDGRKHAEQGILWRKNANTAYCSNDPLFAGTDLNRNFSFEWGGWDGSSGDECSEVFRGPSPASEPETQALTSYWRELFGDHRPNDLSTPAALDTPGLFIDVHAFGRLVLWPWGFPGQQVPNGSQLQTLGRKMAFYNRYRPHQSVFLYPLDGTTTEFTYGDLGIASLIFEVGDQFFERCSGYDELVAANIPALMTAMAVADAPYKTPAGPEMTQLLVLPTSAAPGETVSIKLAAADNRFGTLGGFEPDDGVARFEVRIGEPGIKDAIGQKAFSLSANRQSALLNMETDEMEFGRYRITSRARDNNGDWGPWQSAWLDIVDPAKTTILSGYVRKQDDNAPVAATVSAGEVETLTDPESGYYQLRLSPGDYALGARQQDFRTAVDTQVNLSLGQRVERNIELQPFCEIYSEDAENGLDGWTAEGTWGRTDEDANSGQFSITDSPRADYANESISQLISPVLDFSGFENVRLGFSYRCNTEQDFDFGRLIARHGSTRFSQVFSCTGDTADWQRTSVELETYSGLDDNTLVLRMDSDRQVSDDGWYIDDILITGEADQCPGPPPDHYALFGNLSGTWFDPSRSGEGFVLEVGLNGSQPVVVLTWYTHEDGQPLWLIGTLPINHDQSSATISLFRSSGTGFGDSFDPAEVVLSSWGEVDLHVHRPGVASLAYRRADGQDGSFNLTRLTAELLKNPIETDADGGRALAGNLSGAWFDPNQAGHGLTIEIGNNTSGPIAIVTWYTYLQGQPVWLIGNGSIDPGSSLINVEMSSFSGTGFGPAFDSNEITSTTWGSLQLDFSSCGTVQLDYDFEQGSGSREMTRITGGLLGVGCFDTQ
jgi:murein tripeptide amidase MpaA